MVTVAGPVAAVLLAVSVRTLVPDVGLVAKAAVTPVGRPDAVRLTGSLNPFAAATMMLLVPLPPWVTGSVAGEAESVKLGAGLTVSAIGVDAVTLPDVPVMVTVACPTVAVLLATSVSELDPVVGLVPKLAVTPLGKPVAARVTAPVNPFTSVTLIELELIPLIVP